MPVKINVSNIAAFIGEHPYRSQQEAFQLVAEDQHLVPSQDKNFENTLIFAAEKELTNAVNSDNPEQLTHATRQYENKIAELVVSDAMNRFATGQQQQLNMPVEVVKKLKILPNVETALQDEEIQHFLQTDPTVRTVCRTVNIERGKRLEEESTDKFEKTLGKKIVDRNNKCYILNGPGYVLAGRCDGLTDDAVIETKRRTRYWLQPPSYDIIQLRAYMKLCNRPIGYLNEQYNDGTFRSTRIEHNEQEWQRIENGIVAALPIFWNFVRGSH